MKNNEDVDFWPINYGNIVTSIYDINRNTFCTKAKDKKSVAQHSGIRIEAFCPEGLRTTYYRYIEDT
jgi:hypothetical protein